MKSRLMGLMGIEAAAAIVEALGLPMQPEEYMAQSQPIFEELFTDCQVLPGIILHLFKKI